MKKNSPQRMSTTQSSIYPPTIYVAGFLDVYGFPKTEKGLILDRERLRRCLPLKSVLPLNLEHSDRLVVGCVPGIYDLPSGLFCLGRIHSEPFLSLLDSIYTSSAAARITPSGGLQGELPRSPRLETLHAWLPGLSLSSLQPDVSEDQNPESFLQHVALCALGRRRGTIALYGENIDWLLEKFPALTETEKRDILQSATSWPSPGPTSGSLSAVVDLLVAKAIDASFIKNRMEKLAVDRETVGVDRRSTYLKASQIPRETDCLSNSGVQEERSLLATSGESLFRDICSPSMSSTADDLISIPRTTLMTLLNRTLHGSSGNTPDSFSSASIHGADVARPFPVTNPISHHAAQQPTLSNTVPIYQQAQGTPYFPGQVPFPSQFPNTSSGAPTFPTHSFGQFSGSPATAPHIFQTPILLTPPFQHYVNSGDPHIGETPYQYSRHQSSRTSQKRKLEDDISFPGEDLEGGGRRASESSQFTDLTKSIVEIQNQLKDIRESTRGLNTDVPRGWGIIYPQPPTWHQEFGTTHGGHHQGQTIQKHHDEGQTGVTGNPGGCNPGIIARRRNTAEEESMDYQCSTPPAAEQHQSEKPNKGTTTKEKDERPPPIPAKSKNQTIDASADPDPKTQLQKFFCDELLSK